jgi:hypothetical protein
MLSSAREWRFSSPVQPGIDGIRKNSTASATSPSCKRSERRCSWAPSSPRINAAPSTSRMFDTTLPASDPRTTSGRLSATAISAMITSGALPKLALSRPPMRGPVCSPACSVASPINHASGIRESEARTKSSTLPGWTAASTIQVIGASASEAQRSRRATRP